MNLRIDLRWTLVVVVGIGLIAWLMSHFLHVRFWVAFAVAFAALLVNGLIATLEDRAPGGFLNPKPPERSPERNKDDR